MNKKEKTKKQAMKSAMFIILCIYILFLIIYYINNKKVLQKNEYINSITIKGYKLDKSFKENIYQYTALVEENEVEVVCDTNIKIKGCNEKINLKEKDVYNHQISLNLNGKNKKYTITIKRNIEEPVETSSDIKIKSIDKNPTSWTNKDVTVKVKATAKNEVDAYSFDGGNNWQSENYKVINENQILNIIVKDKLGKMTEPKLVEISKIDKEKPQVQIVKSSASKNKIVLTALILDNLSGVEEYSFNNSSYSNKNTYTVTKTGTYTVKVKDKAGNESLESTINITKSDFSSNSKEEKVYTVMFDGNGGTTSEKYISCKTTKNSCEITTPTLTRQNATILGWGTTPSSTIPTYKVGQKITISKNETLYAITQKRYTITFRKNGADSISKTSDGCTVYNKNSSCIVTMPSITRTNGTVIGWNTEPTAKTASKRVGDYLILRSNASYYAITKKIDTVTFNANGATINGGSTKSCERYNTNTCSITLPSFNKPGAYNLSWSQVKNDKNKSGRLLVGTNWTPNGNKTLYANFNHPNSSTSSTKNYLKERNLSITQTKMVGGSIFEYQTGIPTSAINIHKSFLDKAYSSIPWLFTPGKTFVMTNQTYSNLSIAYGLTHYSGSYYFIDIKYDGKTISDNATLHELAHAWDRYVFRNSSSRICNQPDFISFYNKILPKIGTVNGEKYSRIETFAAMVTNYYWHILKKDTSQVYYALSNGQTLSTKEKNELSTLINKYKNYR